MCGRSACAEMAASEPSELCECIAALGGGGWSCCVSCGAESSVRARIMVVAVYLLKCMLDLSVSVVARVCQLAVVTKCECVPSQQVVEVVWVAGAETC